MNIYLDGEFAFGLSAEAAAGLKVGDELSADRVPALQDEDSFLLAKSGAVTLISLRPRSIAEVRLHLERKGYAHDTIDRVISRLEDVGLLNDPAFARYWIEQRIAFKPRSKFALQQELRRKGLSRAAVDEAVAVLDDEEMARQAANQKAYRWESLSDDEYVQKMSRYLHSRGFSYDVTSRIVEESRLEREDDESS